MYGCKRRAKSTFKSAAVLREEMPLAKPVAEMKEAYTLVVSETLGYKPALRYADSVFIKAVKNLESVQMVDSGTTAASFVDVILNYYSRAAVVSMTLLASSKVPGIATANGKSRRIYHAQLAMNQLDNLLELGSWMSLSQLLDWADGNHYSPLSMYLFGIGTNNNELKRKYSGYVENDQGRTEKLKEIISLVPARCALVLRDSAKLKLEARLPHGTIAPPPEIMDAQCQ